MEFITAVRTDKGNTKEVNEDAALIMRGQGSCGSVLLAAVADGMGGLDAGDKASESVCLVLRDYFRTTLKSEISRTGEFPAFGRFKTDMMAVFAAAGERIAKEAGNNSGTTVSALLLGGDSCYIVSVGDSRVYRRRDGLVRLTKDHSYVQSQIDRGLLTAEEAEKHPMRNVLTQCIGAGCALHPDFSAHSLSPRDRFLLCSDGLRHELRPEELEERLRASNTPESMQKAVDEMVELAMSRGERDNITAIMVGIG